VTTVWEFGEAPLAQTQRYAAAMRRVSSLVLQMEESTEAVDDLIARIEAAEPGLRAAVPSDPTPRVGEAASDTGRVYLDHSRGVAGYNPAFPVYELEADGDHAEGKVNFPVLYEGPPGLVHGGFLSLLFDLVIQQHNCDVGVAGKTTRLEVRYAAPTPLLTDLDITVERVVTGRRIESTATLSHGGTTCCTATMEAVAGRREALPAVSPRRVSPESPRVEGGPGAGGAL